MEQEYKYHEEKFNTSFRAFITILREVISSSNGNSNLTIPDPRALPIREYEEVYNRMNPSEHYRYVQLAFVRNRLRILSTSGDNSSSVSDSWLDDTFIIQFGDGNPDLTKLAQRCYIPVGSIYLTSLKIKKIVDSTMEGGLMMMSDKKLMADISAPLAIKNIIYSLFYHSHSGNDKAQLLQILNTIEKIRGVQLTTGYKVPVTVQPGQSQGLMVSLFDVCKGVMSNMGYVVPDDVKPPSEADVIGLVQNMMGTEQAQQQVKALADIVQRSPGISDAFNNLAQSQKPFDTSNTQAPNNTVPSSETPQTPNNMQPVEVMLKAIPDIYKQMNITTPVSPIPDPVLPPKVEK